MRHYYALEERGQYAPHVHIFASYRQRNEYCRKHDNTRPIDEEYYKYLIGIKACYERGGRLGETHHKEE